jgi:heme/copper-type cytochrome/quinol oxidase subunit 4
MVQKRYYNNIILIVALSQMHIALVAFLDMNGHIVGRESEINSKDPNLGKQKLMETIVLALMILYYSVFAM